MVNAIVWKGKGVDKADWFQPVSFESDAEFDAFKAKTDGIGSKYWVYVERVIPGQSMDDIPYNEYNGSLD